MIKIMIVDDDPLVVDALKTIIDAENDFKVTGIEYSGEAAVRLFPSLLPDIVLMDIRMGGLDGIDAGKKVLEKHPNAKILYLTTFSDDEYIVEALKIGAKGYLLKQNFHCIIPSLKAVFSGQRVFGESIAERLPNLMLAAKKSTFSDFALSEKEYSILIKIADGLSNKEISEEVFLGEGTVRNYISNMLDKLDLRDRTQLAIFYYQNFR